MLARSDRCWVPTAFLKKGAKMDRHAMPELVPVLQRRTSSNPQYDFDELNTSSIPRKSSEPTSQFLKQRTKLAQECSCLKQVVAAQTDEVQVMNLLSVCAISCISQYYPSRP